MAELRLQDYRHEQGDLLLIERHTCPGNQATDASGFWDDCRMPRHHTVPQLYLRNFANEAEQVLLVDRDDVGRSHHAAIRKACAEIGFYRMDPDAFVLDDDSQRFDPEIIEQLLTQFEGAAAAGIQKLVRTGLADVTRDDWYHLINFIALQSVRGNRFREDLQASSNQALRVYLGETVTDDQIRQWIKERGDPATPASISDFREQMLGPKRPRLVPPKEFFIQESFKLALGPLSEKLVGMNWSVIEADQASVLTSDEPVCWWAPGDDPIGYGSAKMVWLPISRQRILQLCDKTVAPDSLGLPDPVTPAGRDGLTQFVNGLIASQAHRWIVHHPDDHPLAGLDLGPRTAWADELVSIEEDGTTRRELWIHRRLPVPPSQGTSADAEAD
jgi:hypothetical protein